MRADNLWQQTALERLETPPLDTDRSCDLVLLGGGFTGCAAALAAAEAGASVLLCEALAPGHGGSGRNVGLVNAGLWLPPEALARGLGPARAARLTEMLGQGPGLVFDLIARHGIACEPQRAGTLHCAPDARGLADLRDRHRQLTAAGAPVVLLSAEDAQARSGVAGLRGALHDPRAGTIQPLAYLRGLARAAQAAGATLCGQTPVRSVRRDGADWLLQAGQHQIRARALLVATNAYHISTQGIDIPKIPAVYYFQAATDPLPDPVLPGHEGCWDTAKIMTSWRRDTEGRLILGAMGRPEDLLGQRLHLGWARRKLARLYPHLAGQRFACWWSGRIAMTGDHIPKILQLGPQGYAITGYSGRGIAPGTVLGQALARVCLGADPEHLPLPVQTAHWEPGGALREILYETAARVAHLPGAG